ncbi:proline iminopeptidase [Ligilactobacillus pobuzihii]|uniref:Proline iminopeptidase n=1 Tax=Ligilactobacillus pobuzihii TaxID=449659 RepID=A0A0R2LAY3_9LACO|nr:proline iminopeptidase-family hydrolase [Ligilactobacillus pobuzihii]KRK11217.1 proline iminopeptidase [Ligilactobacillus pobuzihii E100301 = KCTC 13174]KRN95837.1 proline iminopeptidase [Ligilactobacillus pobuzihii]
MKITEGYMPFQGYQTYYRIIGEAKNNTAPLLLLHGGPGSSHNYFEMLDDLANAGFQLIMYDQLGCGKSSAPDQPELWQAQTWIDELAALRDYLDLGHVHLLGQSFGGMLAIMYLLEKKPQGVDSLILSSTLSSAKLWASEQHRMIKYLPQKEQDAIAQAEKTGNYTTPGYQIANEHYMALHAAAPVTESSPEPLRRAKINGQQAYQVAWGPNEYTPTGTLHDYEYTERLAEITIPTLITNGTDDLCTPLVAKTMYDHLQNAKWKLFRNSRHMPFVEHHDKYVILLKDWLTKH